MHKVRRDAAGRRLIRYMDDPMPLISTKEFRKQRISRDEAMAAWSLVGPTVQKNFHKSNIRELLIIAFMEGVYMATANLLDRIDTDEA